MKQTPELGQKEEVPQYMKEQLERIHNQAQMTKSIKPTHVESISQDLSMNSIHQKSRQDGTQRSEMEELVNHIGGHSKDSESASNNLYTHAKCQKVLFNDKKQ